MATIEERAVFACDSIPYDIYIHSSVDCEDSFKDGYINGATEQKAIDIKTIPQLYARWLAIDEDEPSWEEYANKALEE